MSKQPRAQSMEETIDAVALHWRRHGVSPSVAEIATLTGFSPEYTKSMLQELTRAGRVVRADSGMVVVPSDAERIKDALRGTWWR